MASKNEKEKRAATITDNAYTINFSTLAMMPENERKEMGASLKTTGKEKEGQELDKNLIISSENLKEGMIIPVEEEMERD